VAGTRTNGGVLKGVVLDCQPLWRTAFASMIERLGFEEVELCESAERFDWLVDTMQPHLVIVDADGTPEAAELLKAAAERLPRLFTIVASSAECELELPGAMYVSKRDELPAIASAVEQALLERIDWARLTARELEVLRLVARGASNREVGARLWLSDQTVKFHLARAYRKLAVSGRREAVERLREAGLLIDTSRDLEDESGRASPLIPA
jgi:DNA-binding NarL/FixJ family response regulator